MSKIRIFGALGVALAAALVSGCFLSGGSDDVCRPGERRTCYCPDGSPSESVCLGGEWGACEGCEGGPGGVLLEVYWNINGTEDGTAVGQSWDACAEVGADKAVIKVDGSISEHDCHASGNMSAAIADVADPGDVEVYLADASGDPVTTTATGAAAPVAGKAGTYRWVGDFYWDAFFDKNKQGTYRFAASYEGQSCAGVSPGVDSQVALLQLDGKPVSGAQVCAAQCVAADGAAFAPCQPTSTAQSIPSVTWGDYSLKLSGALSAAQGHEICWEKTFSILVGAGTQNPLRSLDLARVSSSGACAP